MEAEELQGAAYAVWTDLGMVYWPKGAAPESRAVLADGSEWVLGSGDAPHAWTVEMECPFLTVSELRRVDRALAQGVARHETGPDDGVTVVLTSASAEEVADLYNWFYEPLGWLSVALQPATGEVAIWAARWDWKRYFELFRALREELHAALGRGETETAAVRAIERSMVLHAASDPPTLEDYGFPSGVWKRD